MSIVSPELLYSRRLGKFPVEGCKWKIFQGDKCTCIDAELMMLDSRALQHPCTGTTSDEAPPGRLQAAGSVDVSPDSGIAELAHLTPEEQEAQRLEWQTELAKVEDEIATFRHVLASKTRQAQELKRKLGISVWREFQDDMSQGIRNVKESNVFQKTESVLKTTAEKTTSILGGFGVGLTSKIGQLKNSESFRSFEEKVGSAYENVKTKVSSRSSSVTSFDDALREAEGRRQSSNGTVPTSPSIPEDRPLS